MGQDLEPVGPILSVGLPTVEDLLGFTTYFTDNPRVFLTTAPPAAGFNRVEFHSDPSRGVL
jgi:hypothetical protein